MFLKNPKKGAQEGGGLEVQRDLLALLGFFAVLAALGLAFDLRPVVHSLTGPHHDGCALDGPFLLTTLGALGLGAFSWRRARESGRRLAENCRLAAELEVALKRAHLADRAKTNLLAGMSHELRTPLNAILGFAEMISKDSLGKGVPDCYVAYAEDIHRSGQTLLSHFHSILEFVRTETGDVNLSEEVVDLRAAFANIQCQFAAKASDKGVRLDMRLPPRSLALTADPTALGQMLSQLVGNAIRYNRAGGKVVLSAICDEEGSVVVRVEDDGRGIDPGRVAQAMHPFTIIGDGRTRSENGLGFGLAITRALAEMHGATLTLDSAPGEGTVATLRFPPSRTADAHVAECHVSHSLLPARKGDCPQEVTGHVPRPLRHGQKFA